MGDWIKRTPIETPGRITPLGEVPHRKMRHLHLLNLVLTTIAVE